MSFDQKVYQLVKKIPQGKVSTYGLIARKLGQSNLARKVGWVLNKNFNHYLSKNKNKIPCHRVVRADGQLGGYNQGMRNKIKLLRSEGVKIINKKRIDLKKYLYKFN